MAAPIVRESFPGVGSSTASFNITAVNTSQTDSIILLTVYNEHTGTAAATVSSVTSAGQTWALRKRSNGSTTGGLELWWTRRTGTLAGYTITVNMSGAYDIAVASVVFVSGCASPTAPFDSNAILPAARSAPTATWTPSFTGISTSSTDDLLLFISGAASGTDTPAAGFTSAIKSSSGAGSWAAINWVEAMAVTALQSNATFTRVSSLTSPFGSITGEAIFDALAGNAPPVVSTQGARALVLA